MTDNKQDDALATETFYIINSQDQIEQTRFDMYEFKQAFQSINDLIQQQLIQVISTEEAAPINVLISEANLKLLKIDQNLENLAISLSQKLFESTQEDDELSRSLKDIEVTYKKNKLMLEKDLNKMEFKLTQIKDTRERIGIKHIKSLDIVEKFVDKVMPSNLSQTVNLQSQNRRDNDRRNHDKNNFDQVNGKPLLSQRSHRSNKVQNSNVNGKNNLSINDQKSSRQQSARDGQYQSIQPVHSHRDSNNQLSSIDQIRHDLENDDIFVIMYGGGGQNSNKNQDHQTFESSIDRDSVGDEEFKEELRRNETGVEDMDKSVYTEYQKLIELQSQKQKILDSLNQDQIGDRVLIDQLYDMEITKLKNQLKQARNSAAQSHRNQVKPIEVASTLINSEGKYKSQSLKNSQKITQNLNDFSEEASRNQSAIRNESIQSSKKLQKIIGTPTLTNTSQRDINENQTSNKDFSTNVTATKNDLSPFNSQPQND
eukprot:403347475